MKEKDRKIKELTILFTEDFIFSKNRLKKVLLSYNIEEVGMKKAISELKNNIVFNTDTNKDIIRSLLDTNDIDKKTCDRLIIYLDKILKKEIEFLNSVDSLELEKSNVKVRRKKIDI